MTEKLYPVVRPPWKLTFGRIWKLTHIEGPNGSWEPILTVSGRCEHGQAWNKAWWGIGSGLATDEDALRALAENVSPLDCGESCEVLA